jgi:hypothetical protein
MNVAWHLVKVAVYLSSHVTQYPATNAAPLTGQEQKRGLVPADRISTAKHTHTFKATANHCRFRDKNAASMNLAPEGAAQPHLEAGMEASSRVLQPFYHPLLH